MDNGGVIAVGIQMQIFKLIRKWLELLQLNIQLYKAEQTLKTLIK